MGELTVQGAKNAVLPVLAGTILNKGISIINNCPQIIDVKCMVKILTSVGCIVKWEGSTIIVDASNINNTMVPEEYVREMRSSIIMLGAMLAREKIVSISYPGGCSIGIRPIDIHLKAMKKLNVSIEEVNGFIECDATNMVGDTVTFEYPSVGATENIMLLSIFSEGITKINNPAKEPEIVELQNFLNSMGADINGAGTDQILIRGVSKLHDTEYTIMTDRIVAGTYMAATAITSGEVLLKGDIAQYTESIMDKFIEMGCILKKYKEGVLFKAPKRLTPVDKIVTRPYPGFPTDMQSQIMSALTVAEGTSVIVESVFEARYKNVDELTRMGANIYTSGNVAVIRGVKKLQGALVSARELRGGASLIIAGLAADGITIVENPHYILRGYEDIVRDLGSLGAKIYLKMTGDEFEEGKKR
ncbi:MAG: UDP-N-acetylglucosamine 1-carboxyvinyltransferase [Clostridiales bacterium]|nr:UDP-N-acetylglucosamine 1-carboxyvinyltransferase [Clostridiales bacterium]